MNVDKALAEAVKDSPRSGLPHVTADAARDVCRHGVHKDVYCKGCADEGQAAAVPVTKLAETAATPLQEFDLMSQVVTHDRAPKYGHPSVNYDRLARMRGIIDECEDPAATEVLHMLAVKLCRLIETPDHLDSWIDVAGYARVGVMLMDEEKDK